MDGIPKRHQEAGLETPTLSFQELSKRDKKVAKYSEYERKYGRICLLHEISDPSRLGEVVSSGKLYSTLERERLGISNNGKSSAKDKRTGGASQVFTRIVVERTHDSNFHTLPHGTYLILNSSLLDRDDWYGYLEDNYGRPQTDRIPHEKLLKILARHKKHYTNNEAMFQDNIDLKHLEGIGVAYTEFTGHIHAWIEKLPLTYEQKISLLIDLLMVDADDLEAIENICKQSGIDEQDIQTLKETLPTTILKNQIQADKSVQYVRNWNDLINISHGEKPRKHLKIEEYQHVFSKIISLITKGEKEGQGGNLLKDNYKKATKLLIRAAEGSLTESAKNLFEQLQTILSLKNINTFEPAKDSTIDTSRLEKVEERSGTNEGGWYEDKETKKRYYIKFYENPNQARTEWLANQVYTLLDIPVAKTHLTTIDGKVAFVSENLGNTQRLTRDELRLSDDVYKGFVADAYLANWDVCGLNYENIVTGPDNREYRVDNGGSLLFRAQGNQKDLRKNSVPEINTMRQRKHGAGLIFYDIPQRDIISQVQHLVEILDDRQIEQIVAQAGFDETIKSDIIQTMKNRRNYLFNQFNES